MARKGLTRRNVLKSATAFTIASGLPFAPPAFGATEEENILAAVKGVPKTSVKGMIWSNYFIPMQPSMEEFRKLTGIGVDNIQDISIFDIPQRAMAEALSRSPEFDFFHVDAGMIPSLASAGLIEPLDGYMKKASFKIDAVGTYDRLFVYKGQTYGVPTDGNIHTQYIRSDLLNDPTERKRFEDKNSMPAKWPETWEDEFRLMKHFHNPDKGIWGSGNLRNRANGVTWWLMKFYSAGGFPFDNDMNPTINTPAGQYAVEVYLREKEVAHPESPGWGTPQMIPRITGGNVFACQYWDGTIRLNENPEKSKTAGKWEYGLVPGSTKSGKLLHRSISSPLAAVLVNKYSPRKEAAAYLALWWGSLKASEQITSDRVHTFHDAWHKGHMTSELVKNAYTPAGLKAVEKNLQVACPPIYLTGYLEFQDQLSKNLSEAYVGQLKADEVLKRTEEEWSRTIKRTGVAKLKEELATYRNALPQIDKPA